MSFVQLGQALLKPDRIYNIRIDNSNPGSIKILADTIDGTIIIDQYVDNTKKAIEKLTQYLSIIQEHNIKK